MQGADRRVRADAGLLRQHRRRRADRAPRLLGAARLRRRAPRRREVLDQRLPDHPRACRAAGGHRLRRRPDLPRRRHRRGQRRRAGPGHVRRRPARHGQPPGRRHEGLQALGRLHPPQHRPARRVQGHRGHVRRPAAADPAAAVGPRRRRLGRAAPAAAPAARALRLAGRQRRPGAHRRLVLPPLGVRRGAAGAQPVRRGPGGVPGRPGRRRVRVPVRHPRPVPGRQPARGRRLRHDLEDRAAVPRPALAPDRWRVHPVLGVRLVPRRLHGRQVLHRTPARRTGPGVREGQQRDRAGRRPRNGPAPRRTTRTRGRSGTRRCRSRCSGPDRSVPATRARSCRDDRRPRPDHLAGERRPAVAARAGRQRRAARPRAAADDGHDRRRGGDPRGRGPAAVGRTLRAGGAGGRVRRQRRARGLRRHGLDRPPGPRRGARGAGPVGLALGVGRGVRERSRRQRADRRVGGRPPASRGPRRVVGRLRRTGIRRARRAHRDLAAAAPCTGGRTGRPARAGRHPARHRADARAAKRGRPRRVARTACWATPPAPRPRRAIVCWA